MEVNTKVKAGFSNKLFALNVVITIPVPDTTARADMQTSIGEHAVSGICGLIPTFLWSKLMCFLRHADQSW